jgi:hypothetical protein
MQAAINAQQTPTLAEVDLLIVGAGSAGCSAAIAAKQGGARRVMLIERYGFPGGVSTQTLDTFYGFFTPGDQPRKVVGGVPDQVVDALDETGDCYLRPNTYGAGTGVTYNPERLKFLWDHLLTQAGVEVMLHTPLVDVTTDDTGRIDSVIVAARQGLCRLKAARFIDTSGDAELCHWAGVASEKAGELEPAQTLTTTFRMANVDLERYREAGGKQMLEQRMANAVEEGTHPLPRKKGSVHAMVHPGCISTVAVRVAEVDPMDSAQLTAAEQEGRRQAFTYEHFLRDCVPGYERARIIGLSHQIGIREARRVYGQYRLTREDCLDARQFDDQVLLCGAPIEDHRQSGADGQASETHWAYLPQGQAYGVPYRTLIPAERDELWVAGRCFSATHQAHASCRSMGQTMSMGQAVGFAAAIAQQRDCGADEVPINTLQNTLQRHGVILQTPSKIAATAADAWKQNRHTNLT